MLTAMLIKMLTRNAYIKCLHEMLIFVLTFMRAVMEDAKKSSRDKKVVNYGGAPPELRLFNIYLFCLRYYKETSN